MARYYATGTGNYSTSTTWDTVANTRTQHAATNITISTGQNSETWTAPNTTNAVTGVGFYVASIGSAGTLTAQLQLSGVDVVGASVSIAVTSLVAGMDNYLRLASPATYTSTSANAYRWRFSISGGSGTTAFSANGGGTLVSIDSTDNRNVVPSTGDDIRICAPSNSPAITVTIDDTSRLVGSGASTSVPSSTGREITQAVYIGYNAILSANTAASSKLSCRGNFVVANNGEYRAGTVASPLNTSYTSTLTLDQNGSSVNYGIRVLAGGKFTLQGAQKTSTTLWKAKYVSGTGVAASPLVVDASIDAAVGDEFAISPTGNSGTNYNETERRFVITKNSATSYVVSSTSGGSETALTYTHTTDAWIINITRNVVVDTNNSSQGFYFLNDNTTADNVNCDWAIFKNIGSTTTNKLGIQFATAASVVASFDYCVFDNNLGQGFIGSTSKATNSFTGLVGIDSNSASANSNGWFNLTLNCNKKTFTDCFALDCDRSGFSVLSCADVTLTRFYALGCNKNNVTNVGGITLITANAMTLNDANVHCSRTGIVSNGVSGIDFNSALLGSHGTNTTDIAVVSDTYNIMHFDSSTLSSETEVSNYQNMISGSKITFHRLDDTADNHKVYKPEGTEISTGSGLSDTTVRTAGSLATRFAPENSTTGYIRDFKILARANSAVSCFGFIKKNSTFGTDDIDVQLFLPGLIPGVDTPSDTYSMPDDTSWNIFAVAGNYTGTEDLYATVRIVAKSTASGAYCYVDDIYNGSNPIIALDVWERGEPSSIMFEQLGDPISVWSVLTTSLTTSGTIGKLVVDTFNFILYLVSKAK